MKRLVVIGIGIIIWVGGIQAGRKVEGKEKEGIVLFYKALKRIFTRQIEQFSLTAPYALNPAFSAPVLNESLLANVDLIPDTIRDTLGNIVGYDSVVTAKVFFSIDNQTTWDSIYLSLMGGQFYETTWEGKFLFTASPTYLYMVAVDNSGPNFTIESPINVNNTFPVPPNLLANACIEPAGDVDPNAPENSLDLTGLKVSYSDTKIFAEFSNVDGSWPWDDGFLGPWYGYALGIINPVEFKQDSDTVYIAVRADLPIIITEPALYRVYEDTSSGNTEVVRIGSIDYDESGGKLYISFDLDTLINDPYFGEYTGELAVAALTAWATLSGDFEFADGTQPTRWYQRTWILSAGGNTPPLLLDPQVNPPSGDTTTIFDFSVKYVDAENNVPYFRKLIIDDALILDIGTPDHQYADTSLFTVSSGPFEPGWHSFYFSFSDGEYTLSTSVDSFFVEGLYVAERYSKRKNNISIPTLLRQGRIEIPKNLKVNLYSVTGKRLSLERRLNSGIYFLKEKGKKRITLKKIVIF